MNTPEYPSSHSISVPWGTTTGPGDPAFEALLAEASRNMVANMVYDPNLHAGRGGGGGYTMKPGERARIAAAIKEATG